MKLSHYIGEFSGVSITITVEYDHKNNVVDEVISVIAREEENNSLFISNIDLTKLFMKHFESDLDKFIMETDWRQLYYEYQIEKTETIYE